MSTLSSNIDLKELLKNYLSVGLSGNLSDFCSWIKMSFSKEKKEIPFKNEEILTYLEDFKKNGQIQSDLEENNDYHIANTSVFKKEMPSKDAYNLLGSIEYSPVQYVRSRLKYFLERNEVHPDMILDILIAVVEAVENSVKYGDGDSIQIQYEIVPKSKFVFYLSNKKKSIDILEDVERGKFSSEITLMKGIYIMQKLFDHFEINLNDNNQNLVELHAEKYF